MEPVKIPFQIRVTPEVHLAFKKHCVKNALNMGLVCGALIEDYLKNPRPISVTIAPGVNNGLHNA